MAINSVDHLYRTSNNTFTVSLTGGGTVVTRKYWGQGVLEVGVSTCSHSYPIVIKDFPYDFRIIDVALNTIAMTASAAPAVSLFNSATNATGYICTLAATSSRFFSQPSTLNFNKTNVSKTHTLKISVSGVSSELFSGTLIIKTRPI